MALAPRNRLAARHAVERAWHERHPRIGEEEATSRYKRLVIDRVRQRQWQLLGDLTGRRVLEIGCGAGRETVELARRGARVVALDISPTLVSMARARVEQARLGERVQLRVGAAETLVTDRERFDVIVGNGVLHHLDLPAFKATLTELMHPQAVAQFHEPLIHNPLLRVFRWLTPHLRTPTERPLSDFEVRSFVSGFSAVRVEYFNLVGLLLLPAPYLLGIPAARGLLDRAAAVDRALVETVAALRKYCQYAVIQVGAPA